MDTRIFLYIGIILIFTKVFGMMTRKIHLPQVVGALIAGIVLGPSVLNVIPDTSEIDLLAEIGVLLIMFNAGLETDFSLMKKSIKSSLVIGIFEVSFCLLFGTLFAYAFGITGLKGVFIGVLLTATSLGIVVEALHEMGKVKTKVGSSVLGLSVIDDIIGIIILTIILNIATADSFSATTIVFLLLKICAFFAFALVMGFIVQKSFKKLYEMNGNTRRVSILALAFCFIMAYCAEQFGLADITGAYIAGLILCNIKSAEYIEHKTEVLSYLLFSPIFFASIGLKTQLSGATPYVIKFALGLMVVAVITKILGNFFGAKICKFSNKVAIGVGVGMVCRGEVTLIMANKGIAINLLDGNLFPSVVLMVIFTTLITPVLLMYYFKKVDTEENITEI